MALIPREASVLIAINVDRMRSSKLWQNFVDLRNDPANKKKYDDFVRESGLDPLMQLRSITVGVPSDVDSSRELAVVVKGAFSESKLVSYMREQVKREGGGDLKSESYGGKSLYGDAKGELHFSVLDSSTLAIGGKGWIKRVVDLYRGTGTSVKTNEAVMGLLKRIKTDQAIWGGGVIPPGRVQLPSGADIKSLVASIDFATGIKADVLAETPSPEEAKKLALSTEAQIGALKQNPMLGMFGLGQVAEAIKATAENRSMRIALSLNPQQTDDIVNRLKGLAQMIGASGNAFGKAGPQVEPIPEETMPTDAKPEPKPEPKKASPQPASGAKAPAADKKKKKTE